MKNRFKAIVTVGLILIRKDEILLLRRYNTGYADGQYGLVAGCVEDKESVTQAMIREAYEEAGIILLPEWLKMSCVMPDAKSGSSDYIHFYFMADQWQGEISNKEPNKCDDLRFFSMENLPENIVPFIRVGITESLKGNHFVEYGRQA